MKRMQCRFYFFTNGEEHATIQDEILCSWKSKRIFGKLDRFMTLFSLLPSEWIPAFLKATSHVSRRWTFQCKAWPARRNATTSHTPRRQRFYCKAGISRRNQHISSPPKRLMFHCKAWRCRCRKAKCTYLHHSKEMNFLLQGLKMWAPQGEMHQPFSLPEESLARARKIL